MTDPAMWLHANPNILLNCYTQHVEPTEDPSIPEEDFDPERALAMIVHMDPYDPRLKPISHDS
jgi:hypothetical protein